jgi:hypothetical protein
LQVQAHHLLHALHRPVGKRIEGLGLKIEQRFGCGCELFRIRKHLVPLGGNGYGCAGTAYFDLILFSQ